MELNDRAESVGEAPRPLITVEVIREGFFCLDCEWRFTFVNEEAERLLRRKPGELIGKVFWDEYPDTRGTELEQAYHQAAKAQSTLTMEVFYPRLDLWFDVRAHGSGDHALCVSFRDITERKAEEQSGRRAEELLRHMFASVNDYAIFSLDPQRRVTSWNTGAERLFGYTEQEILGQSGDILYVEEDRITAVPDLESQKAIEQGRAEDKRWHLRKDGSRLFVSGVVHVMRHSDGTVRGFTKVAQDITENRRAVAALQQQANLLDLSHDAIIVWKLGGTITYWNRGAEQLYGFTREEALGRPPHELLKAKTPEESGSFTEKLAREGSWTGELCHTCRDGQTLLIDSRQVVIHGPEGDSMVLESNRDVTDRDRAESALREREAQLQLAISIAQMGTFVIDLETDKVTVNDIGRGIYGFTPDDPLTFSRVQTHFHPQDRDEVMRLVKLALNPNGPRRFQVEQRIIRTDGATRWIRVLGQAFFDSSDKTPVRCIGTYTDITQLKEAETVLRESNRRKDEFLAMLAHELRNPLAAIRNALLVVETGAEDPETLLWSRGVIDRQSAQLARLVDDLLDVARITSGKIRLQKAVLDLSTLLDRAAEVVRPIISSRQHELIIHYDSAETLWVEADATRLEQVIVNLLTNAAKYTEPGGKIWLSAGKEGNSMVVKVRDTGVGIANDKLPEMFELFTQGERSIARSEGGLGLGLTIVRTLVEMHGGAVSARSEGIGKGSEFTVYLPAPTGNSFASVDNRAAATAESQESGSRVLVIDDNIDTATGLARLLRRRGYVVSVAHDGPDAINAARTLHPHFILLDIGLPGMDGYEVAAKLRQDICCKDAVFVAITGYGQEEDRRRAEQAGFDHHLVKPMDFERLSRILAHLPVQGV